MRKHREPEECKLDEHLGSTSRIVGTADSATHSTDGSRSHHQLRCVTNADRDQCARNFDSIQSEELQSSRHGAAPNTNSPDDESLRVVSDYHSLFQNWVPPPLAGAGFLSEDQDWLFSSELQEERSVSKRVKPISGVLRCSNPSLWPLAQYLPEAELYALPYTVPF